RVPFGPFRDLHKIFTPPKHPTKPYDDNVDQRVFEILVLAARVGNRLQSLHQGARLRRHRHSFPGPLCRPLYPNPFFLQGSKRVLRGDGPLSPIWGRRADSRATPSGAPMASSIRRPIGSSTRAWADCPRARPTRERATATYSAVSFWTGFVVPKMKSTARCA